MLSRSLVFQKLPMVIFVRAAAQLLGSLYSFISKARPVFYKVVTRLKTANKEAASLEEHNALPYKA